jgi:hypothetical protein
MSDTIQMTLVATDGSKRHYTVPFGWAYDSAKYANPSKDFRLDGQPVVMRGLADGGLFASDEMGATITLSPSERESLVTRLRQMERRNMRYVEIFRGDVDGSLTDFSARIAGWLAMVPPELHDEIEVSMEAYERDDDGADMNTEFIVTYWRPLTAEELAEQEASRRQRAAEQERHERAVLATLLGKYGIPPGDGVVT